jgi:hypothetical protein
VALKANIGVSRKVADNNYGSRGASVNVEVELDSALIQAPDRFRERIRQVFRLAQQAIDDELNRQQAGGTSNQTTTGASNGHAGQPSNTGNGNANNGNGQHNGNRQAMSASEKQLNYARQLAKSISGLGVRNLETIAQKMYSKPLASLTTLDASGLIDTLKAIKAGEINLDAVLGASQ